jgi:RecA-family ATPase
MPNTNSTINNLQLVIPNAPLQEQSVQSTDQAEEVVLWVERLQSIWSEPEPVEWLIEDLIPKDSVIMVAGESGCGKSTFVLSLVHAVAHGESFLNRATKQAPVLIVDRENPKNVYFRRTLRMHLRETSNLHVWGNWSQKEPGGPDCAEVIEYANARKPLIIFDSLVAFHPGSEQDSTETRRFMNLFRKLQTYGATVIVIHHTGKGENTKEYRGSSDIKANVDLNFVLTAKKPRLELLELKPGKCREGEVDTVAFSYDEATGLFRERVAAVFSEVEQVVRNTPGINQSEVVVNLKGRLANHKVRNALLEMESNGRLRVEKEKGTNAKRYFLREAA